MNLTILNIEYDLPYMSYGICIGLLQGKERDNVFICGQIHVYGSAGMVDSASSTYGGVSSLLGNNYHQEIGIYLLMKAYNGHYSRVIIETEGSDKKDITCFPNPSNNYHTCSNKCGLGNKRCENWQAKSIIVGKKEWGAADIKKLFEVMKQECEEAIVNLAIEGPYKQNAKRIYSANPNILHTNGTENLTLLQRDELHKADFIESSFSNAVVRFRHFYISTLEERLTIDVTTEKLRNKLNFSTEMFKKVPEYLTNEEKVFIPNIHIDMSKIDRTEVNNCSLYAIFDERDINEDRLFSSSLIIVYEYSQEHIDKIIEIANRSPRRLKLVIAPNKLIDCLRSKGVDKKIMCQARDIPYSEEQVAIDFRNYQEGWRYWHGGEPI